MLFKLRFLVLLLSIGLCSTSLGQVTDEAASEAALNARIEKLIVQLGAEDFFEREAATKELAELGNLARSALEPAMKNADAEIAARATALIERLPKLSHTVVDALGAPIPLVKMAVRFVKKSDLGEELDVAVPPPTTTIADRQGRVGIPDYPEDRSLRALAIIEHPEFGRARYEFEMDGKSAIIQVPLVRQGTEAYRRALTGQVVDADGKPVAGAVVHCDDVRTPGEGLINGIFPRGGAFSDSEGRFAVYLPSANNERERGDLIPENSRFALRVSVPGNDSYFPLVGRYRNTAPARLELPRATRHFRFRFESVGGGMVEDAEQLRQIHIQRDQIQEGERSLVPLDQAASAKGCKLPPGTYIAELFTNRITVHYQPLVITADSPEELIFRLPPAVTYHGRVVQGVTGEPVPDAFVMGWRSTARNNLALLTAEEWKALRELPSNLPVDDPGLKRLGEFYGVQGLVRTNADGRFSITRRADQEFYGLMAFAEDFVPFKVTVGALKPDDKQSTDTGEFPLFPAAKVQVRPVFDGQHLAVSPEWVVADKDQPNWLARFRAAEKGSDRQFEYVHWLVLNEQQPVYVPAGLQLRLKFATPYDDKWAPTIIEKSIQLKPGEGYEGGDIRFAASLPVVVRAVNKEGKPVEGLPMRRKYTDGDSWCVAHNTDKDGQAYFHVHPNSKGQFRVSDLPGPREVGEASNLFAEFALQDMAPAESFIITVTDEQIQLLLGGKNGGNGASPPK